MFKLKFVLMALIFFFLFHSFFLYALDYERSENGLERVEWEGGASDYQFADIDKDGHVDFVSIGDHGSPNINTNQHGVMVFFSDGAGGWRWVMEGNFGYGGVAVGDVNNDGHWDVGYGMHHPYNNGDLGNQEIEVALGDGSGESWEPWDDGLAVPQGNDDWYGMFGTDLGDFNNDGLLDIGSVSFGSGTGLHVYSNNGDGTWEDELYYFGRANSSFEFYFGDINNDGNLDFACALQDREVYFGNGEGDWINGRFNLPAAARESPYISVDLGDVDGDGGDDLAFINANQGLDVYRFNPEEEEWSSLSAGLPNNGNYLQVDLYDMDMDGDVDLVASSTEGFEVWLQDPEAEDRWTMDFEWEADDDPSGSRAMRTGGDVDHNGLPDVVMLFRYVTGFMQTQNFLHFFTESSEPDEFVIYPVEPSGGERFKAGSIRIIDWTAAIPNELDADEAVVNLYFSATGEDGNWVEIAEGLTNGGRYQWTVPQRVSDNCYIKYEITIEGETVEAITPEAFSVFGAVEPILSVAPGHLHFITPVGEPVERELIVSNVGGNTLEIEPLELEEGAPFSHDAGEDGFQLEPNEERAVAVTFAPEEEGEFVDFLNIASNGGEVQVRLTARTGVPGPPVLVADPDTVEFGRVLIEESSQRRITIRNEGETAAELTIEAAAEGAFQWEGIEGRLINPGADYVHTVQFQPNRSGEFQTELTLSSQEEDVSIPISGRGVLSLLVEFSDDTLDFGRVKIDSSASREFIIYNRSMDRISVHLTEPQGNVFNWRRTGWNEIMAGFNLTMEVNFSPRSERIESSVLEVTVRGEDATHRIIIRGEGYEEESAESNVRPPREFGIQSVAPNPFNESLKIRYALDRPSPAQLSLIDLSGRRIDLIEEKSNAAGSFTAAFNASGIAAGMYFVRLQQDKRCEYAKVLYVR